MASVNTVDVTPAADRVGRELDTLLDILSRHLSANHVRIESRLDVPGSPRYRVSVDGVWEEWCPTLRSAVARWRPEP